MSLYDMAETPHASPRTSRSRSASVEPSQDANRGHKRPRLEGHSTRGESDSRLRATSTNSSGFTSSRSTTPPSSIKMAQNHIAEVPISPTTKVTINTRPGLKVTTDQDAGDTGPLTSPYFGKQAKDHTSLPIAVNHDADLSHMPVDSQNAKSSSGSVQTKSVSNCDSKVREQLSDSMKITTNGDSNEQERPMIADQPLSITFPGRSVTTAPSLQVSISWLANVLKLQDVGLAQSLVDLTKWFDDCSQRLLQNPEGIEAVDFELIRQIPQGVIMPFLQRTRKLPQDVSDEVFFEFSMSLAHLGIRLLVRDKSKLRDIDTQENAWLSQLDSRWYFEVLNRILSDKNDRFSRDRVPSLAASYDRHISETRKLYHRIVEQYSIRFGAELMLGLNDLLTAADEQIAPTSKFRGDLFDPLKWCAAFLEVIATHDVKDTLRSVQFIEASQTLLTASMLLLRKSIVKQHGWLKGDAVRNCISLYTSIFSRAFQLVPTVAQTYTEALVTQDELFDEQKLAHLANKLKTIELHVEFMRAGRIDQRVMYAAILSEEVSSIWRSHESILRQSSAGHFTLINAACRHLISLDVLDIIFGNSSHAEIVSQSVNTFGFLNISNNLSREQVGQVWDLIVAEKDPQVSKSACHSFSRNLVHINSSILQWLLEEKVLSNELRIETMLATTMRVTTIMASLKKFSNMPEFDSGLLTAALKASIEILDEAHRIGFDPMGLVSSSGDEFFGSLKACFSQVLAGHSSSDSIQIPLMVDACRSILGTSLELKLRSGQLSVIGSAMVVQLFLEYISMEEAKSFILEYKLGELMVTSLTHVDIDLCARTLSTDIVLSQVKLKLELLVLILRLAPSAIEQHHYRDLWKDFLQKNLPDNLRFMAWHAFGTFAAHMQTDHGLLDFLAQRIESDLSASQLDMSVLEFLREYIRHKRGARIVSRSTTFTELWSLGIPQLWRMVLQTSEDSVAEQASRDLVGAYLEHHRNGSEEALPEMQPENFARRCLQIFDDSPNKLLSIGCSAEITDAGFQSHTSNSPLKRVLGLIRIFAQPLNYMPGHKITRSLEKFTQRGASRKIAVVPQSSSLLSQRRYLWHVGILNTADELGKHLTNITGWSKIRVITRGQQFTLHGLSSTVEQLSIVKEIQIMNEDSQSVSQVNSEISAELPARALLIPYIDRFVGLLTQPVQIAQGAYEVLAALGSKGSPTDDTNQISMSTLMKDEFQFPYQILYMVECQRHLCMSMTTSRGISLSEDIDKELELFTAKILRLHASLVHVNAELLHNEHVYTAVMGLLNVLHMVSSIESSVSQLAARSELIEAAISSVNSFCSALVILPDDQNTIATQICAARSLEVLFELELQRISVTAGISGGSSFESIITSVLLNQPNFQVRPELLELVALLIGKSFRDPHIATGDSRIYRNRHPASTVNKLLYRIFDLCFEILPRVCFQIESSKDLLDCIVLIFEAVEKDLPLDTTSKIYMQCVSLLIQSPESESLSYRVPHEVRVLAQLTGRCVLVLRKHQIPLADGSKLLDAVFGELLFPTISGSQYIDVHTVKIPVIDQETRDVLYELVSNLVQDSILFSKLSKILVQLSPEPDALLLDGPNERTALRAPEGHGGLRNLSNTCYLNSLFSQLYMNFNFRKLIINMPIQDYEKQKTLHELGILFVKMQSSYSAFVDTEELVNSIDKYGEKINVNEQMDVNEFFNLLFDRLELQIIDPDLKQKFKSMYAGSYLQQIKAEGCGHISETSEPFNTVQLEIGDQQHLTDALQALVKGELLQGDNKYSCNRCGNQVNAVKRACLKNIPDNLIFNLKRFRYDMNTSSILKVNDLFEFPGELDMTPYSLAGQNVKNASASPQDLFELVGVIIHSGTTDIGHYYSYIRQIPSSQTPFESWLQFNDTDVTKFPVLDMASCAFGSSDPNNVKHYSAYMLLYQRRSSIEACQAQNPQVMAGSPVQVELTPSLSIQLAQQNERILRDHVFQALPHAQFVVQLVEGLEQSVCSVAHKDEDRVLEHVFRYLSQISGRLAKTPGLEEIVKSLNQKFTTCTRCALRISRCFAEEATFFECLALAWYNATRHLFAQLFISSFDVIDADANLSMQQDDQFFDWVKKCINTTRMPANWKTLQRHNRGWDSIFSVLTHIAVSRTRWAELLLEQGLFLECLKIIWIHHGPRNEDSRLAILNKDYQQHLLVKDRGRKFSYNCVIELFSALLSHLQLGDSTLPGKIVLNATEKQFLDLKRLNQPNHWFNKLIQGDHATVVAINSIIHDLCACKELQLLLGATIQAGFRHNVYEVEALYVQPALEFVRCSTDHAMVQDVIGAGMKALHEAIDTCSAEWLSFVVQLLQIRSRQVESSAQGSDLPLDSGTVRELVERYIEDWLPPLITSSEEDVRTRSSEIADEIFLRNMVGIDPSENVDFASDVHELVTSCHSYVQRHFIRTARRDEKIDFEAGQAGQLVSMLQKIAAWYENDSTSTAEDEVAVSTIRELMELLRELESEAEDMMNYNANFLKDVEWHSITDGENDDDVCVLGSSP